MDRYASNRDRKLRVDLTNAVQQVTRVRAIQQSQNYHIYVHGAEAIRIEMEHTKPVFVAPRMATPPPMALWQCDGLPFAGYAACTYRLHLPPAVVRILAL